jgi:hypothetical protein
MDVSEMRGLVLMVTLNPIATDIEKLLNELDRIDTSLSNQTDEWQAEVLRLEVENVRLRAIVLGVAKHVRGKCNDGCRAVDDAARYADEQEP